MNLQPIPSIPSFFPSSSHQDGESNYLIPSYFLLLVHTNEMSSEDFGMTYDNIIDWSHWWINLNVYCGGCWLVWYGIACLIVRLRTSMDLIGPWGEERDKRKNRDNEWEVSSICTHFDYLTLQNEKIIDWLNWPLRRQFDPLRYWQDWQGIECIMLAKLSIGPLPSGRLR